MNAPVDARLLHKVRDDIRFALRDLCDPLKRTVWREDGMVTAHHAVSLLKQLREEVAGSGGRAGGPRRSAPIPVAVDALDLWNSIQAGALVLAAETGAHLDLHDTEHAIRKSVAAAGGLSDLEALWGLRNALETWVKAIRTLLDPPKRISLWGKACPMAACGEQTVWRRDERDGEVKRTAALEVAMEEDRSGSLVAKECRCLACNEVWPRSKLVELANAMGLYVPGISGVEEGEPAA
jgi:hypothetical protein